MEPNSQCSTFCRSHNTAIDISITIHPKDSFVSHKQTGITGAQLGLTYSHSVIELRHKELLTVFLVSVLSFMLTRQLQAVQSWTIDQGKTLKSNNCREQQESKDERSCTTDYYALACIGEPNKNVTSFSLQSSKSLGIVSYYKITASID